MSQGEQDSDEDATMLVSATPAPSAPLRRHERITASILDPDAEELPPTQPAGHRPYPGDISLYSPEHDGGPDADDALEITDPTSFRDEGHSLEDITDPTDYALGQASGGGASVDEAGASTRTDEPTPSAPDAMGHRVQETLHAEASSGSRSPERHEVGPENDPSPAPASPEVARPAPSPELVSQPTPDVMPSGPCASISTSQAPAPAPSIEVDAAGLPPATGPFQDSQHAFSAPLSSTPRPTPLQRRAGTRHARRSFLMDELLGVSAPRWPDQEAGDVERAQAPQAPLLASESPPGHAESPSVALDAPSSLPAPVEAAQTRTSPPRPSAPDAPRDAPPDPSPEWSLSRPSFVQVRFEPLVRKRAAACEPHANFKKFRSHARRAPRRVALVPPREAPAASAREELFLDEPSDESVR